MRRLHGLPSQGADLLAPGSSIGGHQMEAGWGWGSGRGLHPVEGLVGRARQGLRQRLGVEFGVGEGKRLPGWLRRGLRDHSQGVTQNVRKKKSSDEPHCWPREAVTMSWKRRESLNLRRKT